MTPLGSSMLNSCAKSYNRCLVDNGISSGNDYRGLCNDVLVGCSALSWWVKRRRWGVKGGAGGRGGLCAQVLGSLCPSGLGGRGGEPCRTGGLGVTS